MNEDQVIERFNLVPNEVEGGYLAGVSQSEVLVPDSLFPSFPSTENKRPLSGSIYYFLKSGDVSIMHRVSGDMVYHFYSGDTVEMLLLYPESYGSKTEVHIFSNNLDSGGSPMKFIPGGTWLGSRLLPGGEYALMGVTMAPGFHKKDYSIGERDFLSKNYPDQEELIHQLTKKQSK